MPLGAHEAKGSEYSKGRREFRRKGKHLHSPHKHSVSTAKHQHSPSKCKNGHQHCDYWKGRGYCAGMWKKWMHQNCYAACTGCAPEGCTDDPGRNRLVVKASEQTDVCEYRKQKGYCGDEWVWRRCRKTCRMCDSGDAGPIEAASPSLDWYNDGSRKTYTDMISACKSRGARLCTFKELCPNGKGQAPYGGQKRARDMWAPIARSDGRADWVQVGRRVGGTCVSHLTTYGHAPWGDSRTYRYWRGDYSCCKP